jgi:hypothetical protein
MKLPTAFLPVAKQKLAICVPCRDQVQSTFTFSLVQLVQYCNSIKLPVNVIMQTGSLISRQRQNLAESAISSNATHILWLDSDMTFPSNIAETLLSHNQDIVACNYSTRSTPLKGVAYAKIGDWNSWIKPNITKPRLKEVAGIGMGCMLTKIEVFSKIEKPWFEVSWVDEYNDFIGEDFYFCVCAREAGYQILVDTVSSKEIKHIGTAEFDLAKTAGW